MFQLLTLRYQEARKLPSSSAVHRDDDLPAKVMLSKLDPTTVVQFEAIKRRARMLAEQHLNRWMFHSRGGNYTKIASELMDINRWPAHGQMIAWEDAKEMGLEIEYVAPDSKEWRAYWSLYCQQRLAVKDGQILFESDYASLPM